MNVFEKEHFNFEVDYDSNCFYNDNSECINNDHLFENDNYQFNENFGNFKIKIYWLL